MLPAKFYEVIKHEGIVTIVTWGEGEPHLVNEWNTYLTVTEEGRILIPAGIMRQTEANVRVNPRIKLALGSKNVEGFNYYPGTAFVLEGIARFMDTGAEFELVQQKYSFATRVLEITVTAAQQMV